MRTIIIAGIVFLAASTLASASPSEPPDYDMTEHCRKISDYSSVNEKLCLNYAREDFNKLKARWSTIPLKTRAHCEQVARSGPDESYRYMLLQDCITEELAKNP